VLEDAFQIGVDQQYLELQRLALGIDQLLPVEFPTGFFEKLQRLAQGVAGDAASIGTRQLEGLCEQGFRQLLAVGREQQPFAALG